MSRPVYGFLALAALAGVVASAPADAAAINLITNGNFETTTTTGTASASTPSQLGLNGYGVAGWTNNDSGYNFIFNPTLTGTSASTGGTQAASDTSVSQYSNGQGYSTVSLWTSQNGGNTTNGTANGNTDPATLVSPTGGNILAADGAYQVGSISQTVSGLTAGAGYYLSFYWAAGQQYGYTGATTENWGVTFGNQSYTTPTVTTPSQGFSPWRLATVYFTASATSQVLSFLATGTPSGGQPPFSLLDGVSLVAAPEPATWAVLTIGLLGTAVVVTRRRRSNPNAAA